MLFRPFFWGLFVVVAVFLFGEAFVLTQTTNFAAWKDLHNADDVPNWARRIPRDFRDLTDTAREDLLAKTLSALKDIAADSEVVPSTRYNAILAAGQLELTSGNPSAAYPAALPYLVDVYQQEDAPQYLKYGALLGIVRHAILGIEHDLQDNVIDLLLETVSTEFMPVEVTLNAAPMEPEVWDWFQLTALDGLSALKTADTDGKVNKELLAVMNHKSQELEYFSRSENALTPEERKYTQRIIELASKAAKTLGDLDYKSAANIDAKAMTDAFIALTKAVCNLKYKIAADSATDSRVEQIVIQVKVCTHSVVWGIRSGPLTVRPTEHSFYASLNNDSQEKKRLDVLMAEIVELTTFFDEGEKTKRSVAEPNAPKAFRFDRSELQDALQKCLATIEEV